MSGVELSFPSPSGEGIEGWGCRTNEREASLLLARRPHPNPSPEGEGL
jgi:hypothetical protein